MANTCSIYTSSCFIKYKEYNVNPNSRLYVSSRTCFHSKVETEKKNNFFLFNVLGQKCFPGVLEDNEQHRLYPVHPQLAPLFQYHTLAIVS